MEGVFEGPGRLINDYTHCLNVLFDIAPDLKMAVFGEKEKEQESEEDQDGSKILPTTLIEFLRNFQIDPQRAFKFQRRLSKIVWQQKSKDLLSKSSKGDKLRLISYSQPDAGRIWHMRVPVKNRSVFPDHLKQIVRVHTGLMPAAWMYLKLGPIWCPICHKVDLRKVPSHFNHCPPLRRRPTLVRHDALCTRLFAAAQHNGVPCMWTPQFDSGEASDLGFALGGKFVHVDVTIASPDSPTRVKGGKEEPLSAAKTAALIKVGKYGDIVACMEENIFVPLAFETSGAFTKEVGILIKAIAEAGVVNMIPSALTRAQIRDELAVVLQVGNALVNIEGLGYLRSLTPAWQAAKQVRHARKEARKQRHIGPPFFRVGAGG